MQSPVIRDNFGTTWNGPKSKQEPETVTPHGCCYRSLSSPAALSSTIGISENNKISITKDEVEKEQTFHLITIDPSSSVLVKDNTKQNIAVQKDTNSDTLKFLFEGLVVNRPEDAIQAYPVFYNTLDSYFTHISDNGSDQSETFMHIEWRRIQSFASFPSASEVRPIHLARAGFYFTETGDRVRCYSCGVTYSGWRANDNPSDIHRQISPSCPHLNGTDSRSLPIDHSNISPATDAHSREALASNTHTPLDGATQNSAASNTVLPTTVTRNQTNSTTPEQSSTTQTPSANEARQVVRTERQTFSQPPSASEARQVVRTERQTFSQPPNASEARQVVQIERQTSQPTSEVSSQARSRLDPLGINFDRPRYPSYAVLRVRISSFQNWPPHLSQTPRQMALAGFLYAGYEDYVRCFFCGGGLRNWEVDDDPWVEHARWFPRCTFLRENKGDDFIALVQDHGEQMQQPRVNEQTSICPSLDNPAVASVLEMGYSPDKVKKILSKLIGNTEATAASLLEAILQEEEEGSSTAPCNNPSMNTQSNAAEGQVHAESKRQEEVERKSENQQSEDAVSLIAENERLKSQRICKICMDAEATIALLPCGHLCCCAECAPAMRKCPICRQFVKGTVRTWLV